MPLRNDHDRQLDNLFAAYRDASEPLTDSTDFLPGLWQKIEARRSPSFSWMQWSRRLLAGAAGACLLLALAAWNPIEESSYYQTTYVDVLDEDQDVVVMAALHPAAPVIEEPIGIE